MLTIYKASAGSGKTYQLALHYIKMLLGVKDNSNGTWKLNPLLLTDAPSQSHRRLLAITFTNKATEEMKNRIVASLDTLARAKTEKDYPYIKELIKEFGCTFEQLCKASSRALVSLLQDFSFFNVSTIDSFFQTILRTFARELGIQGDYNIEIQTENAISEALNLLLDSLSTQRKADLQKDPQLKEVRAWLREKASKAKGKYNPFKRQSWEFKNLVSDIKKIFTEDFKSLQFEFFQYLENTDNLKNFKKALENIVDTSKKELKEVGEDVWQRLETAGQLDDVKKPFLKSVLLQMVNQSIDIEDKINENMKKMLLGDLSVALALNGKKVPNAYTVEAMQYLSEKIRYLFPRYRTAYFLLSVIPELSFVSLMKKYIDRICVETNMLILNDTSSYISRIISGSEIPFIYEHLGTHLRHFLIDEFQDTSRLQWQNLLPLVLNSHSDGDDSLIIGDVKQAIYRFRNSDATILEYDLENIDFPDPETHNVRGTTRNDNCNYRTAHGIIKFNNTIFPLFADIALKKHNPGYSGSSIQQMCAPKNDNLDSRIALHPCIDKKIDNQTISELIIQRIQEQREQGFSWGDIALLYRSGNNVKTIIKDLLQNDIPVQSAENLYVKNAPSVRMLISLLYMLVNAGLPEDRKRKREAVKTEKENKENFEQKTRSKIEHMLFESRYNYFLFQGGKDGNGVSPQEAIRMALDLSIGEDENEMVNQDDKHKMDVSKTLKSTIARILRNHPSTLPGTIEAVLASGLIPAKTIREEKDYVASFSDVVLEYSNRYDNDLSGFLLWWEQHQDKVTITPPPDCDAVRILSIHKSKGLEFKCVHLVDFDWDLVDEREAAWLDLRPADSEHPLNPNNIEMNLGIDRDLFPPLMNIEIRNKLLYYPQSPFNDYIDRQRNKMRIDSLNIAYVGLTRPINQLDVYFDPTGDDTVGGVLAQVLDKIVGKPSESDNPDTMLIPEASYNKETKALLLDIPATNPNNDKAEKTEEDALQQLELKQITELYSEEYVSVVRPDMSALISVDSFERNPDADNGDDGTDDDDQSRNDLQKYDISEAIIRRRQRQKLEKTQRGLDLHEILSHIKGISKNENVNEIIENAILSSLKSEGFNENMKDEYHQIVHSMISNPEASRWFDSSNRIDTEIPYHTPWKEGDENDSYQMGKTRRIDRLVELNDGSIEIVDYKFSKVKDIEYNKQLISYMNAIEEIFPGRKVRGFLWYYDLSTITEVTR